MTELVLEVRTPDIFPTCRINVPTQKKVSASKEDLTQPYKPVINISKLQKRQKADTVM